VELLAVAGYFFEQRSVDDVIAEIEQLIGEGFRHVKVPITDRKTLLTLRAAVGDRADLSVDAHGGWANLADARRHCAALDDLGLAFIEDPLPPARRRLLAELAEHVRTPLAAGEETCGLDDLRDVLDGAAVLRLDATSSGGLTTAIEAAAIAKGAGRLVMTHAFPDLHGHLAGGIDAVTLVEMIPYRSGPNPVDRLMSSCQPVKEGHLLLSEAPGHGMQLDWEAVERHTTATATITAAPGKEANAARGV
jgi:L-alanine-DL-glutamate epimerase-like enolase superfamily enzyme